MQLDTGAALEVQLSVGPMVTFVKKRPSEYRMVTKTYLPSNLCDSSVVSDSSDSSDISDRSDKTQKLKL